MTSQEKKEELAKYKGLCFEVKRLDNEILRMKSMAERTTSTLSCMPKGGGDSRPIEKAAIAIDKLRVILREEQNKLIRERLRLLSAINAVGDGRLRSVLNLRYIEGYTFEKIAVELEISWRHVIRLHGAALESLSL